MLVSGRHLLQLVNDILDISKVEAGRMDLAYERTPIGSIVDVVRSVITAVAAKKGIELDVDMPADAARGPRRSRPHQAGALQPDRERDQVHARAAAWCGCPRAPTRQHLVILRLRHRASASPREDLPRLFREFEQLPQPGGVRPEGTGLGLALTRRLVELHGGKVEVESELGKGSTFSVSCRCAPPTRPPAVRLPGIAVGNVGRHGRSGARRQAPRRYAKLAW